MQFYENYEIVEAMLKPAQWRLILLNRSRCQTAFY